MYIDIEYLFENDIITRDELEYDDVSDDRVQVYIQSAQEIVEKWTQRIFEKRTLDQFIDGNKNRIFLNNPIHSVEYIKIYQKDFSYLALSSSEYRIVNNKDQDEFCIVFLKHIDYGYYRIELRSEQGYVDENGNPPALIKRLTAMIARWLIFPEESSWDKAGILSERADIHSYMLSDKIASASLTGNREMDQIIRMYKIPKRTSASLI